MICQLVIGAERNFGHTSERSICDALRSLCINQDSVAVIMSGDQTQVFSLVQALCIMLEGEDTGVA